MDQGEGTKPPQAAEDMTTPKEATAGEFPMSEWIALQKRTKEIEAQQDQRLVQLAREYDAWEKSQEIDLTAEKVSEIFYKWRDAQGHDIIIAVGRSKTMGEAPRFRIRKFLSQANSPTPDINKFIGKYEDGVMIDYNQESLREGIQISPSGSHNLRGEVGVGYSRAPRRMSLALGFEGTEHSWGVSFLLRTGTIERVAKINENPEERVDPIDKGREFLGILKSAELLGRIDDETHTFVEPPKKAPVVPPPTTP